MTTHYLEEAESLASRLAIMVRGQLSCFGSPLRVRNRYSKGYTLAMAAAEGRTVDAACDFARVTFPGCEVKRHSNAFAEAQLGRGFKPADVMDTMFASQSRLGLDHFSVHTSSLEQIFIAKAKVAEEVEEEERESWENQRLAFRRRKRAAAKRKCFGAARGDDDDAVAVGSRAPTRSTDKDKEDEGEGDGEEEGEEEGEKEEEEKEKETCTIKLFFGLVRFQVPKCC